MTNETRVICHKKYSIEFKYSKQVSNGIYYVGQIVDLRIYNLYDVGQIIDLGKRAGGRSTKKNVLHFMYTVIHIHDVHKTMGVYILPMSVSIAKINKEN